MKVINGQEHLWDEERLERVCGLPGSLTKEEDRSLFSVC